MIKKMLDYDTNEAKRDIFLNRVVYKITNSNENPPNINSIFKK